MSSGEWAGGEERGKEGTEAESGRNGESELREGWGGERAAGRPWERSVK